MANLRGPNRSNELTTSPLPGSKSPATAPIERAPAFRSDLQFNPAFEPDVAVAPGVLLGELLRARDWEPGSSAMSGAEANEIITGTYERLDQAMGEYLGEPYRANWATFGKYASRTAGEQIVRLEAIERSLKLNPGAASSLLAELVQDPKKGLAQAKALMGGKVAPKAFVENAHKLRDTLVMGNTAIIMDVAPAYEVFLDAARKGKDGVAALRAAGFGRAPKDPQGFVINAFRRYQEAEHLGREIRRLEEQGEAPDATKGNSRQRAIQAATMDGHVRKYTVVPDPTEADVLDAKRDQLLLEANTYLGLQEQYLSLQHADIFDNPEIQQLMGDLSKSMTLEDPYGVVGLLKGGGNWAKFFDRMGLRRATEADYLPDGRCGIKPMTIRYNGKTEDYVPNHRPGTITGYFLNRSFASDGGLQLGTQQPKPLPELYTNSPFDRLIRRISKR